VGFGSHPPYVLLARGLTLREWDKTRTDVLTNSGVGAARIRGRCEPAALTDKTTLTIKVNTGVPSLPMAPLIFAMSATCGFLYS